MKRCTLCGRAHTGTVPALAPYVMKAGHIVCALCALEIETLAAERERAADFSVGAALLAGGDD